MRTGTVHFGTAPTVLQMVPSKGISVMVVVNAIEGIASQLPGAQHASVTSAHFKSHSKQVRMMYKTFTHPW